MKVLLFSCLLGGACAFGANPELASEGAVAQGFGTPGAPSEGSLTNKTPHQALFAGVRS